MENYKIKQYCADRWFKNLATNYAEEIEQLHKKIEAIGFTGARFTVYIDEDGFIVSFAHSSLKMGKQTLEWLYYGIPVENYKNVSPLDAKIKQNKSDMIVGIEKQVNDWVKERYNEDIPMMVNHATKSGFKFPENTELTTQIIF